MAEKPYSKVGNTYYPRSKSKVSTDTEIFGPAWRAWVRDSQYYFEFDAGHFSTKLKTVEISEDEFRALSEGGISDFDLNRKYS